VGSQPRSILASVLKEGLLMSGLGVVAGAAAGFAIARVLGSYVQNVRLPGAVPIAVSAAVLLAAAIVGSLLPAARAARVDVVQALRAE
jgi:putative ABC transport system permease protein